MFQFQYTRHYHTTNNERCLLELRTRFRFSSIVISIIPWSPSRIEHTSLEFGSGLREYSAPYTYSMSIHIYGMRSTVMEYSGHRHLRSFEREMTHRGRTLSLLYISNF